MTKYFKTKFRQRKDDASKKRWNEKRQEIGSFLMKYTPLLVKIYDMGILTDKEEKQEQKNGDDIPHAVGAAENKEKEGKQDIERSERLRNEKIEKLLKMEDKNQFLENYHEAMTMTLNEGGKIDKWENKIEEIVTKKEKREVYTAHTEYINYMLVYNINMSVVCLFKLYILQQEKLKGICNELSKQIDEESEMMKKLNESKESLLPTRMSAPPLYCC